VFQRIAGTQGGPSIVIGTYRPTEINRRHPLADALPRLERRPSVAHLRLTRFDAVGVQDFLTAIYGGNVPFRVAETMHARTGGNPFFLEQLLVAAGGVPVDELGSLPLPWNLAEVVRSQIDDLESAERHVIETAAVLGRRVSFDVLAAVTGLGEAELIAVLRGLIGTGLLVEADPDVFGFRHDLTREAIEGRLLGREHRRIHEAALDALRRTNSTDLAAMARHAHGAGRLDELIELAHEGTRHYQSIGSSYQALGLAELGLSEADGDLELRSAAARAAWLAGLHEDAIEHARRLEADADRAGDLERRAEARRLLIRLYWEHGLDAERKVATAALEADLDLLGDTPAQAHALALLAQEAMLDNRIDETVERAERAIEAAERHDLPAVRLAALVERGSALINRRELIEEQIDLLLEVAEEAEAIGEHLIASRAWHNVAFQAEGRLTTAERRELFERMRASAGRAGWDKQSSVAYIEGRLELAWADGDMAGVLAWTDEGRRVDRSGATWGWTYLRTVQLHLERGESDLAAALADDLPDMSREKAEMAVTLQLAVALDCGRTDAVQEHLAALGAKAADDGLDAISVAVLVPRALDAGLSADELRPLVDAVRRWGGVEFDASEHWRLRFEAHLALAAGDAERAIELFERVFADREAERLVWATEVATDHIGAARALLLARRDADAGLHADEAARGLARWEGWRVESLEALERRLGRRGAEPAGGPVELTPREREVLALVAEGLTNAELAERLYISPRTAGVHVSNILAKLGMSSRTEAAAWAVRSGLGVA
jgi:DNA-binding CsgD family transcriptional regulator